MALKAIGCVMGVKQMCSPWCFHLSILSLFSGAGFDLKKKNAPETLVLANAKSDQFTSEHA